MRLLILGGDGFCGWPTRCACRAEGHEVTIVDNFARRQADVELGVESLTPIGPLEARIAAWREVSGRELGFRELDVAQRLRGPARPPARVRPDGGRAFRRAARRAVLDEERAPQALHRRQQHQRDAQPAGRDRGLRVSTSTSSTSGPWAFTGTGPPGVQIPEGYLRVRMDATTAARSSRRSSSRPGPGSVYHMTKTLDQLLFAFYNKNDERPRDRPAPGHRVGHADRGDPARRAADQPVRLRRRLRHGPQPVPHAGRHRLPAHRARHGWPDARLHPPPGHASAASSSPSRTRRRAARASGSSTR